MVQGTPSPGALATRGEHSSASTPICTALHQRIKRILATLIPSSFLRLLARNLN